ncbi:MAG: hypothetical protein ACJAR7_000284, partial [Polaromonas sp.]
MRRRQKHLRRLKRRLQQALNQGVLHFFLGANREEVLRDTLARAQTLHRVMG